MRASGHARLPRCSPAGAAQIAERFLAGVTTDHILELTHTDRERIFNLGYYTWVEQEGVSISDFEERRTPAFWDGLKATQPSVDALIAELNSALTPRAVPA